MSSNMITPAATIAAIFNYSARTTERLSQASTAVNTPRRQSLSADIISIDDNNNNKNNDDDDLGDFFWDVLQTRDSLEIARESFAFRAEQREAGLRALFPFGRNSLELARRNLDRAQESRQRVAADAEAFAFSRNIGSRFYEDRAALTNSASASDPLDYQLQHRDSLELPREKAAIARAVARKDAKKPTQRLIAKAKSLKAAFSGLVCQCFHGEADLTDEDSESAVGLLE